MAIPNKLKYEKVLYEDRGMELFLKARLTEMDNKSHISKKDFTS